MQKHYRILIVDDDPLSVEILMDFLGEKYVLAVVGTGEEVFDCLPRFRPDMILLDIILPGIDGFEVCRRIRTDDRFKHVKILLVSGKTTVEDRLEGYEVGADDFVTKPFVNAELNAKINVFLKLERAEKVDRIKSNLLRLFSQETRKPLSRIIELAEELKENSISGNGVFDKADRIAFYGGQIFDFLLKTMFIRELESGMELSRTRESIEKHIRDAIKMINGKASGRQVSFFLKPGKELYVDADWGHLDKVLIYILDNAAEYTRENTTVTLDYGEDEHFCVIRVSDRGKGIDPGKLENLFRPLPVPENGGGRIARGLSLSISKHILELHGGSIQVENFPGKGVTFVLSLPKTCD